MQAVIAVEISTNKKLGPCSATYASQKSCTVGCPLEDNGCYAESGRTGIHTRRLNRSEATAEQIAIEEAREIDGLSGRHDLRLHVVGDCPTNATAKKVSAAAERFMRRKRPTFAWTYTHSWREVERESWGKVAVLASCHSVAQVHQAMARGFAASLTVEKMPQKAYKEDGLTFFPCLEQTCGLVCVDCMKCWDDAYLLKNRIVILFEIHTATILAKRALAAYRVVA